MSLYLIVNADGGECVCVDELGKVLFQEVLKGDRVYRVLRVEEIRDPRLPSAGSE
jgi:hypothetical protein